MMKTIVFILSLIVLATESVASEVSGCLYELKHQWTGEIYPDSDQSSSW